VHCRWDATIGMNPISPQQQIISTLSTDDKESCRQGFAADGQLNTYGSLDWRYIPLKIL